MNLNLAFDFLPSIGTKMLLMSIFSPFKIGGVKSKKRKKVDINGLLQGSEESIYAVYPDASIAALNKSALERLGYNRKELRSYKVYDIDPNINVQNLEDIWDSVRKNKTLRLETIHVTKNGIRLPTEILLTYFKNGEEELCICYANDIKDEKYIERKLDWIRKKGQEFDAKSSVWEEELSTVEEELKAANENLLMVTAKLQDSQRRINSFIEATSEIVWVGTGDGKIDPNVKLPGWKEYTGQPFEESLGEGWRKVVHPDDLGRVLKHWEEIIEQKKSERIQYRLKRADGQWRWIDAKAVPILDEKGHIKEWIGTITDIHDQKVAEEKAKNDELQFSAVINSTDDVIFSINPDYTIQSANKPLLDFAKNEYGIDVEFGKTSIFDINRKERIAGLKKLYDKVLLGESISEVISVKTNHLKPVEYYESTRKPIFDANGQVIGISSFNKNITQKIEYRELVKRKELQFSAIINSSEDIIISLNKDFTISATNLIFIKRAKNGYNVNIEEGKTLIFEVIPPALHDEYRKLYGKALEGERIVNQTFRTYPDKELPDAYLEEYINPIFDENNEVTGISIFSKNITDKKELVRKVTETEARLASIVGSSNDAIWSIDKEYKLTYFNPYMEQSMLLGFGIKLVLGESMVKIFRDKGYDEISRDFERRYERVLAGENFVEIDYYNVGGSDSYRESKFCPVYSGENIIGISVFNRDVSSRIVNERKIRENEQFLSVSQQIAKLGSWGLNLKKAELKWSRQMYELLSVSSYQKLSYDFFMKLIGEESAIAMQKATEQAVKTKIPIPFEFDFFVVGEEEKNLLGYVYPTFNEEGELIELFGTLQDISEKIKTEKELAKKNSLLDAIIENVPFELWARDMNQQIILQNKACEDRWGDMMGKNIGPELGIDEPVTKKWLENNKKAYNGEIISQETSYINQGTEFSFHEIIAPLLEKGKVTGIVGVNVDITERVIASQKLKDALEEEQKLNEILSQREEELTAKEEELRQSLEELIRVNSLITIKERQVSAIFDNTPDLIFSLDVNYAVTAANKPARLVYKILSGKEPEMEVSSIFEIIRPELKDAYKELYDRVLAGEQVNRLNTIENEKLGAKRVIEEYYSPIKDEYDNVTGIAAFSKNITQKVEAEARVKENEIMLSALINSTTDYILLLDTDLTIKVVNEAIDKRYREVFGINVVRGVTKAIDTLPEYLHTKYNEILAKALRGETVVEYFTRVYSNGMPTLYTEEFLFPVFDEFNKVIAISVFIRDITARKLAEFQLEENELKFRLISKVSNDALWEYDMVKNEILWATGYDKIFGLQRETSYSIELWEDSIYEYDKKRVLDKFSDALLDKNVSEWEDEYRILTSDGSIKHVFDVGQIIRNSEGSAIKMVGGMKDISELKEKQMILEDALEEEQKLNEILSQREEELTSKEEELRQSIEELSSVNEFISQREKQISGIFDNTPDIIVSLDTSLNITAANKTYTEIYQKLWGHEFQIGSNMIDQLLPQNREKYKELYYKVLSGEKINQITQNEEEIFGKYISDEYYSPIKDEYGEIKGIAIFIKDITEKKLAEAKIADSEQKFRLISNVSNDAIWEVDFLNNNIKWIAGYNRIFGDNPGTGSYPVERWEAFIHEKDKVRVLEKLDTCQQDSSVFEWEDEYCIVRADGQIRHVLDNGYILRDEDGKALRMIGGMQDITQLKQQQEAIEKALDEERKLNEILAQREAELLHSEDNLRSFIAELSKANEIISAKELQISSIIENTTDVISSIDRDFKLVTFNNAYRRLVKLRNNIDCYQGLDVFTVIAKEEHESYRNTFQRVLFGESFIQEKKIITPANEVMYLEEFYNPIRNHKGEITGISLFVRDTTDKSVIYEKLEESERMLEIAQEVAKVGSWSLDTATGEIKWSEQTYKIYEVPIDTPINAEKYYEIIGPELAANFTKMFANIKDKGQPYTREFQYTTPGKELKNLFVIGIPIFSKNKKLVSYYGSVQDITERKKIEERLSLSLEESQKLNEVLAQREEELTSSEEELRTYVEELSYANKIIAESESFLKMTQKMAKVGSFRLDFKSDKMVWSEESREILEITPESPLTKEDFYKIIEAKYKLKELENAGRETGEFKSEIKYTVPSGKMKYIVGVGRLLHDNDGKPVEIVGSIQDITEIKEASERLRKSYELLNLTGTLTKVGGWEYDVEHDQYYNTDYLKEMRDIEPDEELTLDNSKKFYAPQYIDMVEKTLDKFRKEGTSFDIEHQLITAKGRQLWVRAIGKAEFKDGKIVRLYGATQDITDKKEAERILITNKELLDLTGNVAKVGGWQIEMDSQTLIWTDETYSIHEVELRTKVNIAEGINFYAPEARSVLSQAIDDAIRYGNPFDLELPFITAKGRKIWVRASGKVEYKNDKPIRVYGALQDITERKIAEQKMLENEANLRAIINNSDFGIWAIDNKYRLIAFNDVYKDSYVRAKQIEPFKGMSVLDKMLKNEKDIWKPRFEKTFDGERQSMEFVVGDVIYEIFFNPITDVNNKNLGAAVFTQDITKRKSIEIQIIESENFLDSIIENIPIGLIILDDKANVLRMNSEHKKNNGMPDNIAIHNAMELYGDHMKPGGQYEAMFKRAYTGETIFYEEILFDFNNVTTGWTTRKDQAWFAVTIFPIKENDKVKAIIIVSRDITLEKQNQLRIRQSTEELIESNKKMAEYRLMALRSVMNPHFLFNSLNSIQYFIAKNDREQALNYLSLFSKLIRSILNSSVSNSNTLADEVNILKFYINLETLRFDNKFATQITLDEDIDIDNIEIPSLILQPYVENAILHGLCNKDGNTGILKISFHVYDNSKLVCTIEDNGIGRVEAKKIKEANKLHKSVGMLVTQERLELINKDNNLSVRITDLYNKDGSAAGTKVEVLINI